MNKKGKKSNLSKNNLNKKFINKESLNLREEIQENLFKEFENIKLSQNLTYIQFKALLSYKKNKPFLIIDCDKNVGNAIISEELYIKETLDYLTTDPAYNLLERDPLFRNCSENQLNFR